MSQASILNVYPCRVCWFWNHAKNIAQSCQPLNAKVDINKALLMLQIKKQGAKIHLGWKVLKTFKSPRYNSVSATWWLLGVQLCTFFLLKHFHPTVGAGIEIVLHKNKKIILLGIRERGQVLGWWGETGWCWWKNTCSTISNALYWVWILFHNTRSSGQLQGNFVQH